MTSNETRRAILANIQTGSDLLAEQRSERSLAELESLAKECNIETLASLVQKRDRVDRNYWLGKGKLEEMAETAKMLGADLLVFDTELSPTQVKMIEDLTQMEIADRSLIIFEIFAQRAKTDEGKIQVELAQLRYRLTRLSGRGEELSRLGGGIGTRGPGETQLETDRRHIMRRISWLRKALGKIKTRRARTREQRAIREIITVAVVGYTNSGKSTIVNALCHADIEAEDRLFMTLDPTARRLETESGLDLVLVDTVGFIRDLPRYLLDAFSATLEEVAEADIIMQLTDISDPDYLQHIDTVEKQLIRLEAASKPRLHVLNKTDKAADESWKIALHEKEDENHRTVAASALTGFGLEKIKQHLQEFADRNARLFSIFIPYAEAGLVNYIQEKGVVEQLIYKDEGIEISGKIPKSLLGPLKSFL